MKALVQNGYGSPDVLALKEVAKPAITDDHVLVRVVATALNAGDYFSMKGSPWLVRFMIGFPRPRDYVPGWDVAGAARRILGRQRQLRRPAQDRRGVPPVAALSLRA